MKVEIKEFIKHLEYISAINRCPLEEIEIYLNGEKVDIHPQQRADFDFTGLSNKDFIRLFY